MQVCSTCLQGDDYNHIMVEALADRLAEAFAEKLHAIVRKELWGYAPDEDFSTEDLLKVKYQGGSDNVPHCIPFRHQPCCTMQLGLAYQSLNILLTLYHPLNASFHAGEPH